MLRCPSCGELGIREHSVLVPLDKLTGGDPSRAPAFSKCTACDVPFLREGQDSFIEKPAGDLGDRTVWIVPPWKSDTDESAFEMSWDIAEAFFENAVEDEWTRPICGLIAALREAAFDSKLRAGQSLHSLGLSRSREHGLRPEQSHLFLSHGGKVGMIVQGLLGSERIEFGPVAATLDGPVRAAIESLASVPID